MQSPPLFLIVDLFCGAGGTTTGFVQAKIDGNEIAKVIACVNHDPKAIKSHWLNHPEVKHFEEDIRTLDLTELIALVDENKKMYPDAYLILWASLECTNFSKAKGGQPRDADSRTLADHLERYIKAIDPDYVQIENVVEFMSWGPLDENGKPVSRKNGSDWMRWCREICDMGYVTEWEQLNSANFGAYTSRNRLFGVFAKEGLPIAWPAPTHAKVPSKLSMYGDLQKWKAVKDVLNFSDEGLSILNRKKPLSPKSLERFEAGLHKYIPQGDKAFIAKYFSGRPKGKVNSVDEPGPTITSFGGNTLVQVKSFSDLSISEPTGSITTIDHHALVQAKFLTQYYGNGFNTSMEDPCPTITTKERSALIQTFILNPSHGGHSTSTENPCPVIVARQDKAPLYLVMVENGAFAVPVYDNDCEIMIRIKKFMAVYGLVDIKMRMLRVPELLSIQGFPVGYQLEGNQSDQKKFIGNSVVPHVVKAWTEAMAKRIIERTKSKRA